MGCGTSTVAPAPDNVPLLAASAASSEKDAIAYSEEKVPEKKGDAIAYSVLNPFPDLLCVFDNKGGVENKPRIGVVRGGCINVVTAGNASVLNAHDLESISLLDPVTATFVGTTSLGETHVFILQQQDYTVEAAGPEAPPTTIFTAKHVAQGQLPVPADESTKSWKEPNRTNIEASRIFASPSKEVVAASKLVGYTPGQAIILYGARGGEGYAGKSYKDQPSASSSSGVRHDSFDPRNDCCAPFGGWWLRWAVFDPTTGNLDPNVAVREDMLENTGENPYWRGLSAVDIVGNHMYFIAAYDGEEDGHTVDASNPDERTGSATKAHGNHAAFKSLIAKKDLSSNEVEIVGRFEGMKIEGLMSEHPHSSSKSGGVSQNSGNSFVVASDDEGLGCLFANIKTIAGDDGKKETIDPQSAAFVNLGAHASKHSVVQVKHWGASGMCLFASALIGNPAEPSAESSA